MDPVLLPDRDLPKLHRLTGSMSLGNSSSSRVGLVVAFSSLHLLINHEKACNPSSSLTSSRASYGFSWMIPVHLYLSLSLSIYFAVLFCRFVSLMQKPVHGINASDHLLGSSCFHVVRWGDKGVEYASAQVGEQGAEQLHGA